MPRNITDGDLVVTGALAAGSMIIPASSIADSQVSPTAGIQAAKLQHQHAINYSQASGTSVVTETRVVHTVQGATGTVLAVDVTPDAVPSNGGGDDKQYTVDVKKSTGGGAWTSILTGVLTVSKTDTARTVKHATLSGTPALVDGDALQVIITASGSTGTQAQGVNVTITTRETAD